MSIAGVCLSPPGLFFKTLVLALSCAFWLAPMLGPVAAQEPSAAALIEALTKKPPTRAIQLADPARAKAQKQLLEGLRAKGIRAISVEERNKVAEIVKERPSVDLEIYFDFDSAAITPKALPALMTLGKALTDSALDKVAFLVAGHTDAKGNAGYNQTLSEQRASAVKQFLIDQYKLPAECLLALGYGLEQLKNRADPLADENRRVQIVNLAD